MSIIRIAGLAVESVVDGPGLRYVIFTQGCPHHCRGCHNPETWDPGAGREVDTEDLLTGIRSNPLLKGVTLSGGDPFMQAGPLAEMAAKIRAMGMDLIVYTGYTWEEILHLAAKDRGVNDLLQNTDILVDGPFIAEQRDMRLAFRGSANQRVIDVAASLEAGATVLVNW